MSPENTGTNWTREQNILALELYLTLPFGRMHQGNPAVIALAGLIGRSAGAVAFRLGNYASLDPALRSRGVRGFSNIAASAEEVWREFISNREALSFEAAGLKAARRGTAVGDEIETWDIESLKGLEREVVVRTRVNQGLFRRMILARYHETCCVTGLAIPDLLVAGHIVPWAEAPEERLNPRNGLCLNPLHDRAFERGLMTVDDGFRIVIAERVRDDASPAAADLLLSYHGASLRLPDAFSPDPELLRRHRERFAA